MAEVLSYEVLEYLESDGYQYIDTGLSAPASTSFSCRMAILDFSKTYGVIGCRANAVISPKSYNLLIYKNALRADTIGNTQVNVNVTKGKAFDVDYSPSKTIINNTSLDNLVAKEDCEYTFYLFNFNNLGTVYATQGAPQRLYGFKMWHGETLVADMLPARKDGVCCLFDKVTQTFFYNIGSGEFIAGPRVSFVKDWLSVSYEGVKDDEVFFSAEQNEGIDREMHIIFRDASQKVSVQRSVQQEGRREVFNASDGTFFLADGGTFNVLKAAPPLDYRKLEWIESDGTQYIDTMFYPNNNTRVVMGVQLMLNLSSTSALFGARVSASEANYAFLYASSTGSMRSDYGSEYTQYFDYIGTKKTTIDKNKGTTCVNEVTQSYNVSSFSCPYSLCLFCINNAGVKQWFTPMRLYYCKIYDNGVLVRDFVPAVWKDGRIGLVDLLDNRLYASSGEDEFKIGNFIE